MTLEDKIKKAITNKAFDRCPGCRDKAVKEIKEVIGEEIRVRLSKLGLNVSKCKACGREIIWIETRKGSIAPITFELINHFADCPRSDQFREQKLKEKTKNEPK